MPVVKMQKVALLAHHSVQEDLLEFLQDQGVMEVSPNEETQDIDHPQVAYEKAEVQFAIDFLQPLATKQTLKSLRSPGSPAEIRKSALRTDFRDIIASCKALEDEQVRIAHEKQALQGEQQKLASWKDLPFSLAGRETETTVLVLGTCPAAAFPLLKEHLRDLPRSDLQNVGNEGGLVSAFAVIWKNDLDAFTRIAAAHSWTDTLLPEVAGTPRQELERIEKEISSLESRETSLQKKHIDLTKHLSDLARLAQYLHWMDEKQAVRSEFAQTDQTVMLAGWIPAKKEPALVKALEDTFPAVALLPIEPRDNEEPPMQIGNKDVIAPFEAVTRLYGLPQSGEMDPTRPLLPFFILYFGLCLTDAGYGLVLALIMGLLIGKFHLKKQDAKLIWLLFYAGIVTFFVSIPFGGWFGMLPEQVPIWATRLNAAGELRFVGQVWDLNKDVDFFRNLALGLGAVQLLFGIFLAGAWKWIHGKKLEAFLSHFSVHLFVCTLALKYLTQLPGMDGALLAIGLLFVWGQGSGKWYVRPLIGILGTVNFLIGVMSNILSYLRILALGLATGALAFAINQIAAVIADLFPSFIGIPIFVLILLFGHLISIALNGLGSFVHSGRLQFIEFFGQFFQGGGREFSPFRRSVHPLS